MANWGPGSGAAAWNAGPWADASPRFPLGASAGSSRRGSRKGKQGSGQRRGGVSPGASESIRSGRGGVGPGAGLASSVCAASASTLVVAAASAAAGSLAHSLLIPLPLEQECAAGASAAGAGASGQSPLTPLTQGFPSSDSLAQECQAGGASAELGPGTLTPGLLALGSLSLVQGFPDPDSTQQACLGTASSELGLGGNSTSHNESHTHRVRDCDRTTSLAAGSEAECSPIELWLREATGAGGAGVLAAAGALAATGAVAAMLQGVAGSGVGLLPFLRAGTPHWGWGPLSLSLFGVPPGQPGKGQGQPGRGQGQAGGGGGRGQGGLDWVDRALVRVGAVRLGFRPPSSITDRLVALNCTVFVFDMLMGRRLTLLGAKVNYLILKRFQLWRLLTPALLHGDPLHLLMNSLALRNVGPAVENLLGPRRFLTVYGLSALGGCAASTFLSPRPAVGASGAVFGLMGALATFFLVNREALRATGQRDYSQVLVRTVALNLLIGAVGPAGIDNWGHIGGLACGSALMLYYCLKARSRAQQPRSGGL